MAECQQVYSKDSDETLNAVVTSDRLIAGEVFTGSPTVTRSSTAITVGTVGINTSVINCALGQIGIGRAIAFSVSGGSTAAAEYWLHVSGATSEGQTLLMSCKLLTTPRST